VAALLLVGFVATLTATLPVGAVVRRGLVAAGYDRDSVRFESARLRWNGIVLEGVEVAAGAGRALELPWMRIRPSLMGLLRRGDGLPVVGAARLCGGWIDGTAKPASDGRRIAGVWVDVDLERCADGLGVPGSLAGLLQGRLELTVRDDGGRNGTGIVRLRDVDWQAPGVPRHVPTRAESAELQWDVDDRVVTIHRLELANEELDAAASGTLRLETPLVDSALALDLTIVPRPTMPQAHRDFFTSLAGGPPDRRGARRFRLTGTVGAPVLERPS
jgi:type II secretion system protein N